MNNYSFLPAILVFFLLWLIFKVAKSLALFLYRRQGEGKKIKATTHAATFIRSIKPIFYVVLAFWLAVHLLEIDRRFSLFIDSLLILAIAFQLAKIFKVVAIRVSEQFFSGRDSKDLATVFSFLASLLVWVAAVLFVLARFGVNVNSLIAGLGIGGVAFALATQKVLGDLFSSLTVYLDKPYVAGDYVVINGEGGVVTKIGWRSTRLRADSGEEIVVANASLVAGKINNFKKVSGRRGTLSFGLPLDTSSTRLGELSDIAKNGAKLANLELERASLVKLAGSSFIFEIVYFVPIASDYYQATDLFIREFKKGAENKNLSLSAV